MIGAFIMIVLGSILFVITSIRVEEDNPYINSGLEFIIKLILNLIAAILFIWSAIIMYKLTL